MNEFDRFKNLSMDDLNKELVQACKLGYLDAVKYLIESDQLKQNANFFDYAEYDSSISGLLMEVAFNEDLDILQYLYTSTPLKDSNALDYYLSNSLHQTCAFDKIEAVKFLLTSPSLSRHAQIDSDDGKALKYACHHNNISIVEYLLTSPELKQKAFISDRLWHDIDSNNLPLIKYLLKHTHYSYLSSALDLICIYACGKGNLDTVKFVLTSTELKKHANIHDRSDESFERALKENKCDILQYLIFDFGIKKNKNIKDIIGEELYGGKNKSTAQEVENWFTLREVNQQLKSELTTSDNIKKKPKL
jgi:ankyrin repeat protein